MFKLLTLFTFVFTSLLCQAQEISKQDYGKLNLDAPAETAQFDFLVGSWHIEINTKNAEGETVDLNVEWTIRYILGGWTLQDNWTVYNDTGRILNYGTMYRTYNKTIGTWTIVEQVTPTLEFEFMTAEKEGEAMVMYEHENSFEGKLRGKRVFYNISDNSFDWQHYSTEDDGVTWTSSGFMHADRILNK
jgi:hypothetical protein